MPGPPLSPVRRLPRFPGPRGIRRWPLAGDLGEARDYVKGFLWGSLGFLKGILIKGHLKGFLWGSLKAPERDTLGVP